MMAEPLTAEELAFAESAGAEDIAVPLSRLVASLGAPSPKVAAAAATAIGTLARTEAARTPLGDAPGLLPALVALLYRADAAAPAARAVANLTFDHPRNRAGLLDARIAPALTAALGAALGATGDADGVRCCAAAAGNLASDCAPAQAALAAAGALPHIVSALRVSAAAALAARALCNVCDDAGAAAVAVRAGAPAAVVAALAEAADAPPGDALRAPCVEAVAVFANAGVAAWRAMLVEAGVVSPLLQMALGAADEEDEDDEDDEEEAGTEHGQSMAESAALLIVGLCEDAELAASQRLGADAVRRFAEAALLPPTAPGRRRMLGREAARRQLARAAAGLCATSAVAEAVCARQDVLQAVLRLVEVEKDDGMRMHGVSALAVLATSEARCAAIAAARMPSSGKAVPEVLLGMVANAKDGDAVALRALATLQNLGVPEATRSVLLSMGAPDAISGGLARFTNPLLLFSSVLVARHLCGPVPEDVTVAPDTIAPSPGAEALARCGAVVHLASLARCERGVPEPDKVEARAETEDGAESAETQAAAQAAAAAATPPPPQKRDIRVALESTRLLSRMCLWSPELRKEVLAQQGILAAFTTTLRSGFDVLQAEVVRGLVVCSKTAVRDDLLRLPDIDELRTALAELHNEDANSLLAKLQ